MIELTGNKCYADVVLFASTLESFLIKSTVTWRRACERDRSCGGSFLDACDCYAVTDVSAALDCR